MNPIFDFLLVVGVVIWTGMPVAFGIYHSGEQRVPLLLLHAFVSGILLLGLALPCFWAGGLNVNSSAPLLLGAVTIGNLGLGAQAVFRRNTPVLTGGGLPGLLAFVVVTLLLASVFLASRGAPYYGRAWGDQLNYSLMANFLQSASPHGTLPDYTRPAELVVLDSGLLNDRLGQSFLHAWVSKITGAPVLETFYLTAALGVLALCITAYICCLIFGLSGWLAGLAAIAAALAPPTQCIQLESFLSQILVTPIVIYALAVAHLSAITGRPVWLALTALATSWVFTAYFEFLPVLGGGTAILLGLQVFTQRRWKPALATCLALVSGIGIALLYGHNHFKLMGRIGGVEGFEKMFPWAFQWKGAARLLIGDGVISLSRGQVVFIAILVLMLTVIGVIGLVGLTWRLRNPLAGALLAVLFVPFAVGALPGEHSYQYYKLLQSFWPLALVGLAAIGDRFIASTGKFASMMIPTAAIILTGFLAISSLRMLTLEATGQSARSGLNPYLRLYGDAAMQQLVNGRTESKLVVNMPNRATWNDVLANGLASLQLNDAFPQIQSKWLQVGDRIHSQPMNPDIPADPSFPNVRSVQAKFLEAPDDLLVLQIGSSYLRPAERIFREVAVQGRMHLFKPVSADWLVASSVVPPFPSEFTLADDSVVVANQPQHYLRLDLESSRELPEGVNIEIRFSAASQFPFKLWHVYSNYGYGTTFGCTGDSVTIQSGPLRRGVTEIFFGPRLSLDRPDPIVERVRIAEIIYGI